MMLPKTGGTYALVLRASAPCHAIAGRLGCCHIPKGWHVYVGSAFGPGGLASRVGRHLTPDKSLRWHIDYLTCRLPVSRVWISQGSGNMECRWAGVLQSMGGTPLIKGFGSSDCSCGSHLIFFRSRPPLQKFRRLAGAKVRSVIPVS